MKKIAIYLNKNKKESRGVVSIISGMQLYFTLRLFYQFEKEEISLELST